MIKNMITIMLFTVSFWAKAQVNVNVQLPPAGLVQKEQLWNLLLVNNGNDLLDISLQLNLQDALTGQAVFTATTGNMSLGKGVKMIKEIDLQPISYSYNLPDFSRNYLPLGAYIACYQVVNTGVRKAAAIAEACVRINIDPLSPPLLNSPGDKTTIESPYPQFAWIPPTPFDMFSTLSYDMLVTEVLEGQSPTEAIQYNTPNYTKSDIAQPYESYPSSVTKLGTGKIYAWQVVAKNGLNYSAKTEVWTFKVAPPSWIKQLIEQTAFIKMKRDNPQKGIAPNGVLKIAYTNETADTSCIVQLKNTSVSSAPIISFELKLNSGENLVQKDIQKLLQAKEGALYEASILNSRNEQWRVLFEIKEYKDKNTERN